MYKLLQNFETAIEKCVASFEESVEQLTITQLQWVILGLLEVFRLKID